ncbi:GATA zinc finger domain-containing protein [Favolaschia claudopus]|uniref:GATA zinc finger domain-containing protein n=1 Tax=Favolaschia claudopus TaxID=2862362 RepID=A0AAW0D1N0_9AGAR
MSGQYYYSQSSSSRNIPRSTYSSLSNAVPMPPPSNSSGYYQTSVAPTPQNYQGYGAPPGYTNAPSSPQYPTTPYTSTPLPTNNPYASAVPPYTSSHTYPSHPAPQPTALPDPGTSIKQCYNCGKLSTPLWRRDPVTQRTLCNACGLYQQQRREPRPQALIDADEGGQVPNLMEMMDGPRCTHCGTFKTSVWRRNKEGEQICNACGVYLRVNGRERPLTLPQSKVKPRAKHM